MIDSGQTVCRSEPLASDRVLRLWREACQIGEFSIPRVLACVLALITHMRARWIICAVCVRAYV